MLTSVLRVSRSYAAPCRRLLSTSSGGGDSTSTSMLLAGSGALLGATALGSYAVFGQGSAEATNGTTVDEGKAAAVAAETQLIKALEKRLAQLELAVAGGKQMALVFIKPHACNPKVVELVRTKLAAAGIHVTSEGQIGAERMDKEMLIDNHYGAIAAKAVKLKPEQLNVPAKGKAEFKKLFGLSWDDALARGLVFNAADATAKLGGDGNALEAKWSGLSRGRELLKFGGGFYVGKVGDIFVINGFYAAMRAAYTTPPAELHYFTVQWSTETVSWEAFRADVLGATNPGDAAKGSVRRDILEQWETLGLKSKPNVGENGVHASASPFEALAERMNWTGVALDEDLYGRGLLAAGIPAETIMSWTEDPQVTLSGKKGSLFDFLEDKDADWVLAAARKITPA